MHDLLTDWPDLDNNAQRAGLLDTGVRRHLDGAIDRGSNLDTTHARSG